MLRLNRDTIPHYSRILLQRVSQEWSSRIAYLRAAWWGVSMGRGCTFVGGTQFRRTPGSRIEIGEGCRFLSSFASNLHGLNRPCMISTLTPEAEISIGSQSGMSGTVISCALRVTVGKRVLLGANCSITDSNSHEIDFRARRGPPYPDDLLPDGRMIKNAPVEIGDDVFVGMHSIILKGVTIGQGSVVAAGSVVSKSIPPYCIAGGNPAKPIKPLPGFESHWRHDTSQQ